MQVPNIGARGQRHRLRFGILSLGAAVVLGVVLFGLGAPRGWRIALFVPLWIGALGIFQARGKT